MDNTFDKMFYSEGQFIGGVDESGVSDIAGPLVAACVVLPKIDVQRHDLKIFEVNDSKLIPEKYRKEHAEVIWQSAYAIGIGEVSPSELDFLDKQHSVALAMYRAVAACRKIGNNKTMRPDFLVVDGPYPVRVNIPQAPIVDADQKSLCVAAASIIAKVYRDDIMLRLHENYPAYDWKHNKGYPCEKHFKGIDREGILIGVHRTNFWPFSPNTKHREKRHFWERRRAWWKKITEQKLATDLGEDLWTTKPQLKELSTNSKPPSRKGATSGKTTKDCVANSKGKAIPSSLA